MVRRHSIPLPSGRFEPGWGVLTFGTALGAIGTVMLRLDVQVGADKTHTFQTGLPEGQRQCLLKLSDSVVTASLEGNFGPAAPEISLERISPYQAVWRLLWHRITSLSSSPKALFSFFRQGFSALRNGKSSFRGWLRYEALQGPVVVLGAYPSWIEAYDKISEADREQMKKAFSVWRNPPVISVVMPVYNTPDRWLRAAIDSVVNQVYPHWDLCIADDASTLPQVKNTLQEYAARDSRIRVTYRQENGHISRSSNSALALATGSYIALLDHDDELSEDALYLVAQEILAHPTVDLIYSDEDKIDVQGRRFSPHFKTKWNRDLFYSFNLVNHLGVYRTALVREVGGFRDGFEGSQDYDLALRVVERTTPERIRHIPHVLYHWRSVPGSIATDGQAKSYAAQRARAAIQEHLNRTGVSAKVMPGFEAFHRLAYALPERLPTVSVVIGTKDRADLLRGIVTGLLKKTDYPSLEIIIVDNRSVETETFRYFADIRKDPRVRVLSYDAPFNFSAINNLGAREAKGEIIALLNNDLEVLSADWLREMVAHALRPEVGVVGAKLYYPDDTIQHAGVVLGIGGVAGHAHKRLSRFETGYVGRAHVTQGYSSVTGACMVMRKAVFEEVGGLDETNLPIAFNDIDFCLRVREKDYAVLWTPHAELYHLESASRGSDTTAETRPRFNREFEFMRDKWGEALQSDPFYSSNLTLSREDFSLAFPPRIEKPSKFHSKPAASRTQS